MASTYSVPDQPVFTTGQVAKICHVAPRTASKWIDKGLLQGYRLPGTKDRRVSREALVSFMEGNKIVTGSIISRIVLLSVDTELASAISNAGMDVRVLESFFDLGEQLHVCAPHAVVVDFSLGIEAEQVLERCAIRFPKVRRFAITDGGKICGKALETFSRPFDPALIAERLWQRIRPGMGIPGDPLLVAFREKIVKRKDVLPGRSLPMQAPSVDVDPDDKTTLLGFFENVYRPHRLIDGSTSQITKHRATIRTFSEVLGRTAELNDLTDDNVSKLMQHIAANGRKPGTINHQRNHLLALANHAVRRGLLRQVFEVAPVRDYQHSPKAWTQEQLAKLMDTIRQLRGMVRGIPAALWWEALHRCLWDSGVRIGALMQIKWTDIDLDRGILRVRPETQKDREEQQHPLKPSTVEILKSISQPVRELVFDMPIMYASLFYQYKRILKAAGLPNDRASMFHRMRKSVASHYEREGGNATSLLGHSSRKVTMRYIDPTISSPKPAAAVLFELSSAIGGAE